MNIYKSWFTTAFIVTAICLLPTARAQDVERKPGWEKEQEILKKTGQLPEAPKAGLGGKDQISHLEQLLLERLNLTAQQQERIHAILQAHAVEMVTGVDSKRAFTEEFGEEYKDLKRQAEQAKKDKDKAKLKSIMERLAELRKKQVAAKTQSAPDYSMLLSDIEKELTKAQAAEFLKLTEELGMVKDPDAGAKLLPKEYIHIITSASVGLNDEQRSKITTIYRETQDSARKIGQDREKLEPLLARMRADIRAVLNPSQRRIVTQLLLKAESRKEKPASSTPSAEEKEESPEASGDAKPPTGDPPERTRGGKKKARSSGEASDEGDGG